MCWRERSRIKVRLQVSIIQFIITVSSRTDALETMHTHVTKHFKRALHHIVSFLSVKQTHVLNNIKTSTDIRTNEMLFMLRHGS